MLAFNISINEAEVKMKITAGTFCWKKRL